MRAITTALSLLLLMTFAALGQDTNSQRDEAKEKEALVLLGRQFADETIFSGFVEEADFSQPGSVDLKKVSEGRLVFKNEKLSINGDQAEYTCDAFKEKKSSPMTPLHPAGKFTVRFEKQAGSWKAKGGHLGN